MGPQDHYFTEESKATFLGSPYTVTTGSNRMGYRLDGPPLKHVKSADIVSDGTPFGGIQVPGHGQPIVLMADCQTTGGYAKIACVITPDLPALAQARPGDEITFSALTIAAAHEERRVMLEEIAGLGEALAACGRARAGSVTRLDLRVQGERYRVLIEPR
jgi:allophanate hydrolase subunit 2